MKIILASNNKHKSEEFKLIFEYENLDIQLLLPSEMYLSGFDVDETGSTLEENAIIKARAFYEAAGMPAISDDSGLEVDALDLRPGVLSARYSGQHGNDAENRILILEELGDLPQIYRSARFKCVICYFDGNNIITAEGKVEGSIADSERGEGGFGYDPIFIPNGYKQTFAEISRDEKNKISHRGIAIKKFIDKFKEL